MDKKFESYFVDWLTEPDSVLPPYKQKIGKTTAEWFSVKDNQFGLIVEGGTPADKEYVEAWVAGELEQHNLQRASFSIESAVHYGSWADVMEKAKRLVQDGKVNITRNGYHNVQGVVEGDTGTYQVEIGREDPQSRAITQWKCTCPWGEVSWGRTRRWKKFEGRSCSHCLATYWKSLATPLDEDIEPGGSPQAPNPSAPGGMAPGAPGAPQAPQEGAFGQPPEQRSFGPEEPTPGQAPSSPNSGIIPEFPYNPENELDVQPVSIPGRREQTPLNPLQMPMTFSKTAAEVFTNGEMVQLKEAEIGVTVGLNAGQKETVPQNSVGEVLGSDPLGLVNVYFAGPASNNGQLEWHGVTAWLWPSQITRRPDIAPGGPAVQRHSAWEL